MSYLNDDSHDRLEGHDQNRNRALLCGYSHSVAANREEFILALLLDCCSIMDDILIYITYTYNNTMILYLTCTSN